MRELITGLPQPDQDFFFENLQIETNQSDRVPARMKNRSPEGLNKKGLKIKKGLTRTLGGGRLGARFPFFLLELC